MKNSSFRPFRTVLKYIINESTLENIFNSAKSAQTQELNLRSSVAVRDHFRNQKALLLF